MKKTFLQKVTPIVVVAILCATTNLGFFQVAMATGSLNTLSDTLTNENATQSTSNDIFFKLGPGLLAASGTIALNFAAGSVTPTIANTSITSSDIKLFVGGTIGTPGSGTTETFNTITSGAATASSTLWGLAGTSSSITITAPSGTSSTGTTFSIAANTVIEVQIGTAAGGANRITNPAAGTEQLAITTSTGPDSSTVAIPIITNDQVVVTATVAPIITFNLTAGGSGAGGSATNAVDFGPLSSTQAKCATSGAGSLGGFGPCGTGGTTAAALDLSAGTNAGSGYTLTYIAPTNLSNGSATIPATGTTIITGSNSGTPGIAGGQFAMSAIQSVGSGATIPSAYQYSPTSANWKFATAAVTTLASNTAAAADTISVRYIANIPSTQAPGNYTVTQTFDLTGNF